MELAAHRGLAALNSAETIPNERGLGKPCAGKPPARFDEGESSVAGDCGAALSLLYLFGGGTGHPSRVDTPRASFLSSVLFGPQNSSVGVGSDRLVVMQPIIFLEGESGLSPRNGVGWAHTAAHSSLKHQGPCPIGVYYDITIM